MDLQLPLDPDPGADPATGPQPPLEPGAPLAARLRPRQLSELLGQPDLAGARGALRAALVGGPLPSLVLVGPPGSGKTSLAQILASSRSAHLVALSAVSAGVGEIRQTVAEARQRRRAGQATVLFLDEIHHFSRTQQDALLPHLESGLITLIGATTENPSFQLTGALLSRLQVFELEPLSDPAMAALLDRALGDEERGLGGQRLTLSEAARDLLLARSAGDARTMLNALEQAAAGAVPGSSLEVEQLEQVLGSPVLRHDRAGDLHYQLLSAFIKSLRGSDADAAVYWLARLLEAGEDPTVPARRMVILAAEDIGLAQPRALEVALAAHQAVRVVGMPEAQLPLTEATLFLALSPKSNSVVRAYGAAREDVQRHLQLPVPLHLRNAVTELDRRRGYGAGYEYAHDQPGALVSHGHLPAELVGQRYYQPSREGLEPELARRLDEVREHRDGARGEGV